MNSIKKTTPEATYAELEKTYAELAKYKFLTENMSDTLWTMDKFFNFTYASPSVKAAFGFTPDEVIGKNLKFFLTDDSLPLIEEQIRLVIAKGDRRLERTSPPDEYDIKFRCADGSFKWVNVIPIPVYDSDGYFNGYQGITRDIDSRKQAEFKLREMSLRLSLATRSAQIGIWEYNIANDSLYWDDIMCELHGSKKEFMWLKLNDWLSYIDPGYYAVFKNNVVAAIEKAQKFDTEILIRKQDGLERFIQISATSDLSEAGTHEQKIIGICYDITERKLREIELQDKNMQLQQANMELTMRSITDSLTGLLNHQFIISRLHEELVRADIQQTPLSVMMMDIDYFKYINDNYGHLTGDKVLVQLPELVRKCIRATDLLGRYGGEEFLIVLPNTDLEEAGHIAERIRETVETHSFPGITDRVTMSIGIASYDNAVDNAITANAERLIQSADTMLYKAKKMGRNRVEIAG